MLGLKRDTLIAIFLLTCCGMLGWSSLSIRDPGFGTLSPATWPQIVVGVLTFFSLIYFFQSFSYTEEASETKEKFSLFGFLKYYQNPILCFFTYGIYLTTLPVLGALIGGILLVFFLLNILGGWAPKLLITHAIYAVLSIGFMWSFFTFGLRVILPQGEIFTVL